MFSCLVTVTPLAAIASPYRSASSAFSGNAAEPIFTEPGVVGSPEADEVALGAALEVPGGAEDVGAPAGADDTGADDTGAAVLLELPLLPHATRDSAPIAARAA
jgi:hypothetical protein